MSRAGDPHPRPFDCLDQFHVPCLHASLRGTADERDHLVSLDLVELRLLPHEKHGSRSRLKSRFERHDQIIVQEMAEYKQIF